METFGFGSWKIGYEADPKRGLGEKVNMWLDCFGHRLPGMGIRLVLVFVAMGVIYLNGYASSQRDFDRDIEQGWYIKIATKFEEAAQIRADWKERGCTPWGTECEESEVTK